MAESDWLPLAESPADSGRRRANDYEEDEQEDFVSRKLFTGKSKDVVVGPN